MSKARLPLHDCSRAHMEHTQRAADRLNQLISHNEDEDWDFVGLEKVTGHIPGDCLSPSSGTFTMVQIAVFENRPR